ncbi:hypothetical protein RN001_013308 [Aquatica leii]|uniref:Protein msta n=1 Tax=Aquatica leii TaxID=1421715 RepID=A0AAN7QD17_9COLE|nr:hypothetical protein RN001_013308 [Aquatica leii]
MANCEVCHSPASQKCAGCHNVFYCNKEHQKEHWKSHKKQCRPFEMQNDGEIGRHFVATKDIKEGDIIFVEKPMVVGPLQLTLPTCMGCGNYINSKSVTQCSKCGWPLCCKECENNPAHIPECYYTIKRGKKVSVSNFEVHHPIYRCVTVLRCLYQKYFAPDVWKKIVKLESHCKTRENTEGYKEDKIYVADFILNFFQVEELFTKDEILKVCGVIMVNCHEIPLSTPSQNGLFNLTSIFEHNCRSNAYKTFSPNGSVKLIAGTPINKGEHISICYTEPLQTTLYRQKHLADSKFFSCLCKRCQDVTEFGTNLTALKCQNRNCDGVVLPKSFQSPCSHWSCNICGNQVSTEYATDVTKRVGNELVVMDKGSVDDCKTFLKYYEKLLSLNHAYMIDVKLALAQLIGDGSQTLQSLPVDDLLYKQQLCKELIDVIKVIAPAEKRVVGILLVEIYAAKTELQRRKPTNGGNFKKSENPIETILECMTILRRAIACLQHEPDLLFEGKLCQQARKDLEKLEICSKTIFENPSNFA